MKKIITSVLILILLVSNLSLVYAFDSEACKTGDIIQFGTYPQSKIADEELIEKLNGLIPQWSDWISYGYYSGNGQVGSMVKNDYMKYIDVTLDNEKYRGVKFTSYRPIDTCDASKTGNSQQAKNGYSIDEIYWFRFEPLKWRVLSPQSGFVVCESVIDAQPYTNTLYKKPYEQEALRAYFNDSEYKNFANNYESSTIRYWLNDSFYNTAFSDAEKEKISATIVTNNEYRVSDDNSGYEALVSNSEADKIFLLSGKEVSNANFGFNPCNGECKYADEGVDKYTHSTECFNADYNATRMAMASDYAYCQGLIKDEVYETPHWLLRTYGGISLDADGIYYNGYVLPMFTANCISGIRPAMMLKEHTHTFETTVKNPSCTVPGGTRYTCLCGEEYTHSISFTGHTFNGSVCINCDYNKADNCSCNCHKGGIAGFMWQILNFFYKLFRFNSECSCGAEHY